MTDITIGPPARVRIEQVRGHVRVMVDTDDGTHVLVRIVGYVAQVQRYQSAFDSKSIRSIGSPQRSWEKAKR